MNFALEHFRKRQIPTIVYLFVSIIAYLLSFRQSVVSYTTERDQMSYKTYVVEGVIVGFSIPSILFGILMYAFFHYLLSPFI